MKFKKFAFAYQHLTTYGKSDSRSPGMLLNRMELSTSALQFGPFSQQLPPVSSNEDGLWCSTLMTIWNYRRETLLKS
ncbi:hypothetical protein J6590_003242 [Homalodisca vitripennis]|nr:hypothetical protein J6590_003242 [Homalodisca vitripennis]